MARFIANFVIICIKMWFFSTRNFSLFFRKLIFLSQKISFFQYFFCKTNIIFVVSDLEDSFLGSFKFKKIQNPKRGPLIFVIFYQESVNFGKVTEMIFTGKFPQISPCTGSYLWATDEWTYLNGTLGARGSLWPSSVRYDPRQAAYCHWFVETDSDRQIVTEVLQVPGTGCVEQCALGFFSVRVEPDWGNPEIRLLSSQNN